MRSVLQSALEKSKPSIFAGCISDPVPLFAAVVEHYGLVVNHGSDHFGPEDCIYDFN